MDELNKLRKKTSSNRFPAFIPRANSENRKRETD